MICSASVTTCHHYGWRLDESRCTQQCEASVPSFNALLHPDPPARRHRRIHIDPDQLPKLRNCQTCFPRFPWIAKDFWPVRYSISLFFKVVKHIFKDIERDYTWISFAFELFVWTSHQITNMRRLWNKSITTWHNLTTSNPLHASYLIAGSRMVQPCPDGSVHQLCQIPSPNHGSFPVHGLSTVQQWANETTWPIEIDGLPGFTY